MVVRCAQTGVGLDRVGKCLYLVGCFVDDVLELFGFNGGFLGRSANARMDRFHCWGDYLEELCMRVYEVEEEGGRLCVGFGICLYVCTIFHDSCCHGCDMLTQCVERDRDG